MSGKEKLFGESEIIKKIKGMSAEKVQFMLFLGFLVMMAVLPLPQVIFPREIKSISVQATILTITGLYFLFFIVVEFVNGRYSFRGNMVSLAAVGVMILFDFVSVIFSGDKLSSIYGSEYRGEGLLTIISYVLIFVCASLLQNKRYRTYIMRFFLCFGVLISIYGCFQFLGITEGWAGHFNMASAPFRNPNFYASFSVLFIGVCWGGFFYAPSRFLFLPDCICEKLYKGKCNLNLVLWYVLGLFAALACVSASSSTAYVGVVMIFLMLLFLEFLTKTHRYFRVILLGVGFAGVLFLLNYFSNARAVSEFVSVAAQIKAEGSVLGDRVGSGRMEIWKNVVALLPEHWLFGCGIENLDRVYWDAHGYYAGYMFVDRTHNEYLHIWVTEGLIPAISYLVFLFSVFIPGVLQFVPEKQSTKNETGKKKGVFLHLKEKVKKNWNESDEIHKIVFLAFFGYIAQAFFNIRVVQVAPYFWMICGFLVLKKDEVK